MGQSEASVVLGRGLRLLRLVSEQPQGLTVTQIARALDTHRSGIYRLLGPLLEERLVVREADGRYFAGHGLIDLANGLQPRLKEAVYQELQRTADDLSAVANLMVRDDADVVLVASRASRDAANRILFPIGTRHRADVTAAGRALGLQRPPLRTDSAELVEARRLGYAVSTGELLSGVTGLAVPLEGVDGPACLCVTWTGTRNVEAAARRITDATREIERHLKTVVMP